MKDTKDKTESDQNAIAEDETAIKRKNLYELILSETRKRVYVIILLTFAEPLFSSSRFPFIYLFIQSFDASVTTTQLSILFFSAYIFMAMSCIGLASAGDTRFRHDKVYIFCFLMFSIGLSIEAISNSFELFIIGHIVGKVPNIPIAFAYIATVLPHKYAVKYCSFTWSICGLIYLLGPIIGALIAEFINYRAIFIFNAIFHIVYFLIALFSLNNSIKYLEHKQTLVGIIDGLDKDEQFPICVRNAKKASEKPEMETNKSDKGNVLTEYIAFWRSLPVYDLWMLLCSIFINDMTLSFFALLTLMYARRHETRFYIRRWNMENIFTVYFVLFVIYDYDATILSGTFMLVQISATFGVVTLIVPHLLKRIIPSYIWVITLFSAMIFLVSLLCIVADDSVELQWLYNVGIGVTFGITTIVSEMCILELQPTQHAGKVTGLKSGLKFVMQAVSLGLVALFWREPYNSLWIGVMILALLSCLLSIVMMIMTKVKKQSTNDDDK